MARDDTDSLSAVWRWFAETQFAGYSPIYERVALELARNREVLRFATSAPPAAHMPTNLLAAVHYVLLGHPEHPLAEIYAGRVDADPLPAFLELLDDHRDEVASLLETRRIQTNECGRSALIGPGLTWLARRFEPPIALVDVGASGGLNLICDRYLLDYQERGATGPRGSPVKIICSVKGGEPPIAAQLPMITVRTGIDRSPIDLADPDDARWLLACAWPGTGRIERTAAAIRLAQSDLPEVRRGDANDLLPGVLSELPPKSLAVVVTTWAFAYFSAEDRARFSEILRAASLDRTVAWLSAEGAATVGALADEAHHGNPTEADVLGAVVFHNGASSPHLLGYVHSHGLWLDWRA